MTVDALTFRTFATPVRRNELVRAIGLPRGIGFVRTGMAVRFTTPRPP